MKKVLLFIWGILFIVCFASCNKETVQPNNEKKASTNQPSSSQESPAPAAPATPASGCPHSTPPCCPHSPGNPTNPMNPMG
jgi:hypothetical protein